MNTSRKLRFTLIELLMVVLVIGILVSLLYPSMKNGVQLAKHATCLNTQKQFYTTLVIYSTNNKSSTPVFKSNWGHGTYGGGMPYFWDVHSSFYNSLLVYTANVDIFHCTYTKEKGHAVNNPSNTCTVQSSPSLLHIPGCSGLMFWGISVPKGDIRFPTRTQWATTHESPTVDHRQTTAYDQPTNFTQIQPSRPLISDPYYVFDTNTFSQYLHNNQLFGQVNGDGSGRTAKKEQLYILKASRNNSYSATYGIP
jgi:prepilin-type N-terminal cleavage/methylation domain-containing protein